MDLANVVSWCALFCFARKKHVRAQKKARVDYTVVAATTRAMRLTDRQQLCSIIENVAIAMPPASEKVHEH